MKPGTTFVKAQIEKAIASHAALLESMDSHEREAADPRYRDLCERHLTHMREHQLMLQELRAVIDAGESASPVQGVAAAIGTVTATAIGVVRSLADARISDYERLVSDLNLARELEVQFKTFRDAGRTMKIDRLAKVGEIAERHHDDYSADAKRLLLQMFVERAQGATISIQGVVDSRADFHMR